jgi:hypothetical protein
MTEPSRCARDGCDIAVTGKCLEGFEPPSTCPYLSVESSPGADAAAAEGSAFIDLPTGEALTETQATEITRQGVTRVVIIAGPTGSGKTTILTSLFESFLEAPFGNFLFGGSRTLVGFERRCHDARSASGRDVPHTSHTPVDVVDFLHLRLLAASGSIVGAQNLLLSDISGERFRTLRDSSEAVKKMPMLKRADHLCLVLDGEKLADRKLRHAARTDARTLLRSILEAGILSSACKVNIVFAKWDLVLGSADREAVTSFVANTRSALEATAAKINDTRIFEIAARPATPKVPFAFGLPTLLRYWLQEPELPKRVKMYLPRPSAEMREAARFVTSVFRGEPEASYDVEWV